MSNITASLVKDLRERTGAGMMDCKRALQETEADLDAAIALLREKGLASAAKKAGRVAAEGLVGVLSSEDGSDAIVLELNCETDFVAKTDNFGDLLTNISKALLNADIPAEGTAESVADIDVNGTKLSVVINEAVASIGENIGLRRYTRIKAEGGAVGSYIHAGGKIGVLIEVGGATAAHADLTRSLAMQIAAAFPRYVRREEVPAAELDAEREIFKGQALASGKPENVIERIVDGKIDKYYREICLVEQDYVRDPDLTIEKLLAQVGKETGAELEVRRFVRYQLGEGIEKKEANLAEEVAEQLAKGS